MGLDHSLRQLDRTGRWRALTAVASKFGVFAREPYFRESWQAALEIVGDALLPALQSVAVLTLKPDAILSRRYPRCLRYMARHGFTPLMAAPIRYTRANTRAIWRYQWNIATLDRLALGDLIHTSARPVMVFFRDERPDPVVPGSVRLAELKGSSLPWERSDHHLRTALGGLNRMIVLVHCSDEPIDIVRELGIVLGRRPLATVYRRLRDRLDATATPSPDVAIERIHQPYLARQLEIDAAADRVHRRLTDGRGDGSRRAAARAEAALREARQGAYLSWRSWSRDLRAAGVSPREWDATLVASHYIRHDVPGATCIIGESGVERWRAGEGLLVRA